MGLRIIPVTHARPLELVLLPRFPDEVEARLVW
jgi:hypothetical protein